MLRWSLNGWPLPSGMETGGILLRDIRISVGLNGWPLPSGMETVIGTTQQSWCKQVSMAGLSRLGWKPTPAAFATQTIKVSMAGLSRLGWKRLALGVTLNNCSSLNGRPLPSGMETISSRRDAEQLLQSQWPASPVWDGNNQSLNSTTVRPRVSLAGRSRLGWKLRHIHPIHGSLLGLAGSPLPSGMEADRATWWYNRG